MKLSRLLAYGIAGIIAGLLIENKTLIYKGKIKDEGRKLRKKLGKQLHTRP